jgi:hypothetical protein
VSWELLLLVFGGNFPFVQLWTVDFGLNANPTCGLFPTCSSSHDVSPCVVHNKLVCARACKQAKKRGKKKMGSSSKTNAATTRGKIKEKKDEFNQIFSDRKSWGSSAIEEICEEFKENWQAEFQKKFVAANSKFLSISRFTTTRVYLLLLWGRGKLKARTK